MGVILGSGFHSHHHHTAMIPAPTTPTPATVWSSTN